MSAQAAGDAALDAQPQDDAPTAVDELATAEADDSSALSLDDAAPREAISDTAELEQQLREAIDAVPMSADASLENTQQADSDADAELTTAQDTVADEPVLAADAWDATDLQTTAPAAVDAHAGDRTYEDAATDRAADEAEHTAHAETEAATFAASDAVAVDELAEAEARLGDAQTLDVPSLDEAPAEQHASSDLQAEQGEQPSEQTHADADALGEHAEQQDQDRDEHAADTSVETIDALEAVHAGTDANDGAYAPVAEEWTPETAALDSVDTTHAMQDSGQQQEQHELPHDHVQPSEHFDAQDGDAGHDHDQQVADEAALLAVDGAQPLDAFAASSETDAAQLDDAPLEHAEAGDSVPAQTIESVQAFEMAQVADRVEQASDPLADTLPSEAIADVAPAQDAAAGDADSSNDQVADDADRSSDQGAAQLHDTTRDAQDEHVEHAEHVEQVAQEEPAVTAEDAAASAEEDTAPVAFSAPVEEAAPADTTANDAGAAFDIGPLNFDELDGELVDIFVEEGRDLLDHCDGLIARMREVPEDLSLIHI